MPKATITYHPKLASYSITYERHLCAWEDTYEQALLVKKLIDGTI